MAIGTIKQEPTGVGEAQAADMTSGTLDPLLERLEDEVTAQDVVGPQDPATTALVDKVEGELLGVLAKGMQPVDQNAATTRTESTDENPSLQRF